MVFVFGYSFQNSLEDYFEEFGVNKMFVSAGNLEKYKKQIDDELILSLEKQNYVKRISEYVYGMKSVRLQQETKAKKLNIYVLDFKEEVFDDLGLEVEKGKNINEQDKYSIYVGSKTSEKFFDDKLNLNSKIIINDKTLYVRGIFKTVGNDADDSLIYANMDFYREIEKDIVYDGLIAIIKEDYDMEKAKENTISFFKRKLGKESEEFIEVLTFEDVLKSAQQTLSIIELVFLSIGVICIIVGGLGIINVMYVIISTKEKDIGIMKAVGAKDKDILIFFILLSSIFSVIGAVFAVILGTGTILSLQNLGEQIGMGFLKMQVKFSHYVISIIFGAIIGFVSGYLPSKKASKMQIIDTLRK